VNQPGGEQARGKRAMGQMSQGQTGKGVKKPDTICTSILKQVN